MKIMKNVGFCVLLVIMGTYMSVMPAGIAANVQERGAIAAEQAKKVLSILADQTKGDVQEFAQNAKRALLAFDYDALVRNLRRLHQEGVATLTQQQKVMVASLKSLEAQLLAFVKKHKASLEKLWQNAQRGFSRLKHRHGKRAIKLLRKRLDDLDTVLEQELEISTDDAEADDENNND